MTETTETILAHPESIDEAIVEKLYPMNDVRVLLDKIVDWINPGLKDGTIMHDLLSLGIVLGFVVLVWLILRLLFVRTLPRLMERISFFKGERSINTKIIQKLISIVSISIFSSLLVVVWQEPNVWFNILKALCSVAVT